MKKLKRSFYLKSPLNVARNLLGKYLVYRSADEKLIVKIIETEAYLGEEDPACHTYKGKKTTRTQILYGSGGYAYIYLIYGMYCCFNAVADKEGEAGAVFIRSAYPIKGIKMMAKNRGIEKVLNKDIYKLTNGPGKLCQAIGITKDINGEDLCGKRIFIVEGEKIKSENIISLPRINIDYAGKACEYPWRFAINKQNYTF